MLYAALDTDAEFTVAQIGRLSKSEPPQATVARLQRAAALFPLDRNIRLLPERFEAAIAVARQQNPSASSVRIQLQF
jgi:hypothetical protein